MKPRYSFKRKEIRPGEFQVPYCLIRVAGVLYYNVRVLLLPLVSFYNFHLDIVPGSIIFTLNQVWCVPVLHLEL